MARSVMENLSFYMDDYSGSEDFSCELDRSEIEKNQIQKQLRILTDTCSQLKSVSVFRI